MGNKAADELSLVVLQNTDAVKRWSNVSLGNDYRSLPENHPLRRLALEVIKCVKNNLLNDTHIEMDYESWADYASSDDNSDLRIDSGGYVSRLSVSDRTVLIGQLVKSDLVAYSEFKADEDITDSTTNRDATYYVAQSMTHAVLLAFYNYVVVPMEHEGLLSEEDDDDE